VSWCDRALVPEPVEILHPLHFPVERERLLQCTEYRGAFANGRGAGRMYVPRCTDEQHKLVVSAQGYRARAPQPPYRRIQGMHEGAYSFAPAP